MSRKIRLLLIAPHISREATGEAFVAYKWAQSLQPLVDLSVLAFESVGHTPLAEQLPQAKVITWREPKYPKFSLTFVRMVKPYWFFFQREVRRFLGENLHKYDLAHQIMPLAMRYPSPLRFYDLPYVIGPLGGSLPTPPGFLREMESEPWYVRLRSLDNLRLAYDPLLRKTYMKAALILGVAPYVEEKLKRHNIPTRKYRNVLELGVTDVESRIVRSGGNDIKLLHVGRGVRTKGLRDVVRAMALIKHQPGITLTSVGGGPEIDICRREAEILGVSDRVMFHGHISRREVEEIYGASDALVFPSFREPTGNVIYEAMRWGLPVIAADRGGPAWIVDENTGIKVAAETPEQLARDVASAIERLATDPELRHRLGEGGRLKLLEGGLWDKKALHLVDLYREILASSSDGKRR